LVRKSSIIYQVKQVRNGGGGEPGDAGMTGNLY